MQTEAASKLVTELKVNRLLPNYNEAALAQIQNDIKKTYLALQRRCTDENFDPEDNENVGSIVYMQHEMERNLRCSMAYL